MSGLRRLFSCIGMAVLAQGPKALIGAIPFGEALYDVAADALKRLRAKPDAEVNAELAEAAQTEAAAARQEAEAVAAELAADQPPEVRVNLVSYLSLVPDAVRQSLKRPADPTGKTVPTGQSLSRPEQLLAFLPSRLPRFKPGDRPTPGGNWELVEMLGVGGFGEVWKARHPHFKGIQAALKFCLDPRASETLRHEGAILDRVMQCGTHPGIVPLRQAHLDTDPCYLEYEYLDGGNLCKLIAKRPSGEALHPWAAKLMRTLAGTVGWFHRLNPPIVHRDLKPANILLQRVVTADQESMDVNLRIADFGIGGLAASRSLEQAQGGTTSRGDLMLTVMRGSHTPLYASPQQAKGEPPDVRDDLHALGVIWYQLLTGDLSSGVGTDFRDDLKELGADEPTVALLGRCVSGKAERRPKDAAELAAQFDALLAGRSNPPVPPASGSTPAGKHEEEKSTPPAAPTGGASPPPTARKAVWVVRAGKWGDEEQIAFDNNLVTIGWNELLDLSRVKSKEELETLHRKTYPDEARPAAIGARVSQIWAFRSVIKAGDFVIIPLKTRSSFAIGEVTGPYTYRTDLGEEVHHTVPVKWLNTDLPRSTLKQDLFEALNRPKTVNAITGHDAEARFRAVLAGETETGASGLPQLPSPEENTETSTGQRQRRTREEHDAQLLAYLRYMDSRRAYGESSAVHSKTAKEATGCWGSLNRIDKLIGWAHLPAAEAGEGEPHGWYVYLTPAGQNAARIGQLPDENSPPEEDSAEADAEVAEAESPSNETNEPWNGEFCCNFNDGENRSWADAVQYGFISAGGGEWYSRTLQLLNPGDRVWVKVPACGFVGVGRVMGRAEPFSTFKVRTPEGEFPVLEVAKRTHVGWTDTPVGKIAEYFVPVKWLQTVPVEEAVYEVGLFGNQNTVCKPTAAKWRSTVELLKKKFPDYNKALSDVDQAVVDAARSRSQEESTETSSGQRQRLPAEERAALRIRVLKHMLQKGATSASSAVLCREVKKDPAIGPGPGFEWLEGAGLIEFIHMDDVAEGERKGWGAYLTPAGATAASIGQLPG